ncbi:MAG: DUF1292 domain-containing protein [Clostridia bacterium]|nr:DUF1292 domain-containing protein [Clostridia bacterium]
MSDNNEFRDDENIIVLTDEDGTDVEFEFCASIEYEGKEYVVLLPADEDDGEVVILEVIESDDEESDEATYVGVDDDDILEAVFERFKEQAGDEYDFD